MSPSPGRIAAAVVLMGWLVVVPDLRGDEAGPEVAQAGVVVDEAGKPVPGVRVELLNPAASARGASGADGRFLLRGRANPDGRSTLILLASGDDGRLGIQELGKATAEPVTVVLKPARKVEVRVVDGEGKPVGGASVGFLGSPRRAVIVSQILEGRTDPSGVWEARVPADTAEWDVYAFKDTRGFDHAHGATQRLGGTTRPPLPDRLTITLDGARPPLRVRVVDGQDRPLPGVEVGPTLIRRGRLEGIISLSGGWTSWTRTGVDGMASIAWLPARAGGEIAIAARSFSTYSPDFLGSIVDRPPNEVLTIVQLPYATLAGRVTTADGKPAAGVSIVARGLGGGVLEFRGRTQTDAEGRYSFRAYAEQIYGITATKGDQAAPYRSGVILRTGRPIADADMILVRGTKVTGRVTVGPDRKPAANATVTVSIEGMDLPRELLRPGNPTPRASTLELFATTDRDGRYRFVLGPGGYRIQGDPRALSTGLVIGTDANPAEIVRDFALSRRETGVLRATIVEPDGKPVLHAELEAVYQSLPSAIKFAPWTIADTPGEYGLFRRLEPMIAQAATPDGSRAGIARVGAEAEAVRIVVRPTAEASGRLVDPFGVPIAGQALDYGIRVRFGPTGSSPSSVRLGGRVTTDDRGRFVAKGLVVGETYEYALGIPREGMAPTSGATTTPSGPGPMAIGDVAIEPEPSRPVAKVTPARLLAASFAAGSRSTPEARLRSVLLNANLDSTRPALFFGRPDDPACLELFRVFHEERPIVDEATTRPIAPVPADLRRDYEMGTLDAGAPGVVALATGLGLGIGDGRPPILAVLSDDGKLAASFPIRVDDRGRLDATAFLSFLIDQKRPPRDAEAELAAGLARARAGGKRVFLVLTMPIEPDCRRLGWYLADLKATLETYYVFVKVDALRDAGVETLLKRFPQAATSRLPWYAILDDAGKSMVTSNVGGAGGENIGFPTTPEQSDQLIAMIRDTAPRISGPALMLLRLGLTLHRPK